MPKSLAVLAGIHEAPASGGAALDTDITLWNMPAKGIHGGSTRQMYENFLSAAHPKVSRNADHASFLAVPVQSQPRCVLAGATEQGRKPTSFQETVQGTVSINWANVPACDRFGSKCEKGDVDNGGMAVMVTAAKTADQVSPVAGALAEQAVQHVSGPFGYVIGAKKLVQATEQAHAIKKALQETPGDDAHNLARSYVECQLHAKRGSQALLFVALGSNVASLAAAPVTGGASMAAGTAVSVAANAANEVLKRHACGDLQKQLFPEADPNDSFWDKWFGASL